MKKIDVLNLTDLELDKAVKIAGTPFDRRRKYSDKELKKIKKLYATGKYTICQLAEKFNSSYIVIRYHVDEDFKKQLNESRKLYRFINKERLSERVVYKKSLIFNRKLKLNNIGVY